jgi:hypothetical protein
MDEEVELAEELELRLRRLDSWLVRRVISIKAVI